MALSILSNQSASKAASSLHQSSKALQKSLTRLSSGKKINSPADDSGGLAVSMKLSSAIGRNKSVISNIQNAISFAEVQDGALGSSVKIIDRMSELKTLSTDVIKSASDIENYNVEFKALQEQLHSITTEKFNGISLFGRGAQAGGVDLAFGGATSVDVSVFTTDQGSAGAAVMLSKELLLSALTFNNNGVAAVSNLAFGAASSITIANDKDTTKIEITALSIANFTKAIENISSMRASNGASMARLQLGEDHARLTKANLEAANSRIMDVDVAEESTRFAKYNILTQASAAMLSQANQASSTALLLL
ncbi:MAG: flagellin [Opitutae bacterium]